MKTSLVRLAVMTTLVSSLSGFTMAGAKEKEYQLSDWKIGKVLFGSKITRGQTKGNVVVVENWGVHCPPCIASLPHLAKLEKENRDKGLIVIGAESQGSTKDQIKPLIEKAGVEYTIVDSANGPLEVTGIPRAFVFDRDSKLVFDGNPNSTGFTDAVTKALGSGEAPAAEASSTPESSAPLIASRSWTNADGKEIRAAVKSADDTTVTFLMDGGKEVKYPLAKLSEDSRTTIKEAGK